MAEVGGIGAHVARLRRVAGAALRDAADEAVMAAARDIEADAKALAGDGPLAAGIRTERVGLMNAEVQSTAPHAAVVEFGTSTWTGKPYLRPAAARGQERAMSGVARAIRSAVRGGR